MASQRLAAVAEQVKRANPVWSAGVVQLLIEANDVVVRLQAKGATAFARWIEKHPAQSPQDASDSSPAQEHTNQESIAAPEQEGQ